MLNRVHDLPQPRPQIAPVISGELDSPHQVSTVCYLVPPCTAAVPLPARDCRHQGAVDSGGGRSPSSRRVSPGCYARLETLTGAGGTRSASPAPRTPSSTTCSARSSHAPTSWTWPARVSVSAPVRIRRTCIRARQAFEHGALETGLRDGDLDVEAGTAWVWAREQFQGSVDTLFVDEGRPDVAGQRPGRTVPL